MAYVREVTETDLYNCMCLFFQFDSICVVSELFYLVSLLSKQFRAFKAGILLLHVFSLYVTLTRVRVTHFSHSRHWVTSSTALPTDLSEEVSK